MNRQNILITMTLVFLLGSTVGYSLTTAGDRLFASEAPFTIGVDSPEGTNIYILTEVDEGDNDEETVVEEIHHEFVFTASSDQGMIVWDFGDGATATGATAVHDYDQPGMYSVSATQTMADEVITKELIVVVHLNSQAEVDNMECVCAPTAKDTIILLSDHEGQSLLEGFVRVEHDGSSESCSLRNPLQECHLRVLLQRTEAGELIEETELFDDTFRSNEQVVDFSFPDTVLEPGQRLQLRLETDQVRDWHKPNAEWSMSAPLV